MSIPETKRLAATTTTTIEAGAKRPAAADKTVAKLPTRLEQLEGLLATPSGATLAEMMVATGWQQHSIRGAMAGALKKRGLGITSEKIDGVRRYRASRA